MKKLFNILFIFLALNSFSIANAEVVSEENNTQKFTNEQIELLKKMQEFTSVYSIIKNNYVDVKTTEEVINKAIEGMVSSLDPHSEYLNVEKNKDLNEQTSGEFGGVGLQVTEDEETKYLRVISPIEGSPASKEDIKSGDLIIAVNDESTKELSLKDAVLKMRGEVGTVVSLTIKRENNVNEIELERAIIEVPSVFSEVKGGNVGYIKISIFSENTTPGLVKAIEEMEGENITGYILDLRNNPGGLLNEAISVSDVFLNKVDIVSIKSNTMEQKYTGSDGDLINGKPLIVLVNSGSASASEIVAGALQDNKRALIIGTRTFGKGSVQSVIPLEELGKSIRLTTARYYTPNKVSIQGKGIIPDITVRPSKIQELDTYDYREENYKNALDLEETKEFEITKHKEYDENYDYQLVRAMDMIKSASFFSK